MKKATLILGLLAASTTAAWAQSSVTMYGIVDAAVKKASNANAGVSEQTMAGSGMSQSRLGFNINEDMGGGLRAIANLEHRLALDTGTTGASSPPGVFWFQSWVGIQSNDFGRVTLGRQYNVLFDLNASTFSSFKWSTYIDQYKPELGMLLNNRQDNMVKYSLTAGPVAAELQVSAGEGSAVDKSAGGMIKFTSGAFSGGVGYLETTGVAASAGKKAKGTVVGGAYTSGPVYINLSWYNNKFDTGAATLSTTYNAGLLTGLNAVAGDIRDRDMISVGATYQLTTAINLGAQYWRISQKHYTPALASTTSKGDFMAFVADYAFSKRTDAYWEVDRTNFKGALAFANGAQRRYTTMVGLRHRF